MESILSQNVARVSSRRVTVPSSSIFNALYTNSQACRVSRIESKKLDLTSCLLEISRTQHKLPYAFLPSYLSDHSRASSTAAKHPPISYAWRCRNSPNYPYPSTGTQKGRPQWSHRPASACWPSVAPLEKHSTRVSCSAGLG